MARFATILFVIFSFAGCSFEQDPDRETTTPMASIGTISSPKADTEKNVKTPEDDQLTTIDDSAEMPLPMPLIKQVLP